ncbi:hypothetical protein BDW62DRAFT_214398 [Aspergillus aurantiobrunneus]
MLSLLPVEILLQLDDHVLLNIYQLSHRLHAIIVPRLREIYRSRTVLLNADWNIQPCLTERHTLKFVKELVFVAGFEKIYDQHCFHDVDRGSGHDEQRGDALGRILMPLFRGLTRNSLVSFRNIECLSLNTATCREQHDPHQKLSISRFHRIRTLSWRGICMINHCIALTEFFQINAHRLEELELSFNSWIYTNLRRWADLHKDWTVARNAFASKVLALKEGETRTVFPRLTKLSLCNLHRLRALKLRECQAVSDLLYTVAEVASTVHLVRLDIEIDATNNQDTESFRRFFDLSFPDLEDVFIHVDAWDDESTRAHWRSILAPGRGRQIKRFVYHRRHEAQYDPESILPRTPAGTAVALGDEMLTLLRGTNLQCVGISDDPSSLMKKLSQAAPLEWEILNIRSSPTHPNQHIQNLERGQPRPTLDFETMNDLLALFSTRFPGLYVDIAALTRIFSLAQLIELFAFASWAFGPNGLPKLDLLVYGEVESVHTPASGCICLCRDTAPSRSFVACVPFRLLEITGSGAAGGEMALRRKIQDNAEFLETRPSCLWGV